MLRPRGPVAIFGASNFPFAFGTLGGDTASALAAGCPVIVKGHPSHPGTSEMFASAVGEALRQCKLPDGLFTLLQGRRHELSAALVKDPNVTAVGFTGSLNAGRALFDLAAARPSPIPVFAEMGSLNPVVILPAALAERGEQIAQDLANSILLGGGQFCTKPGLIFTLGPGDGKFLRDLAAKIESAAGITMLNQNLRDSFKQRILQFKSVPGVRTVTFGAPSGHAGVAPSLFETDSQTFSKHPELHEEAFGPGAIVVRLEGAHPAAAIEELPGSLTGTIHIGASEDAALARVVINALEQKVGRVIVNGYPTGVEVCNAIVHGGPYPATTDPGTTSVGSAAIRRWVRMTAYQDTPDALRPPALQNANPLGIERLVNGKRTAASIG
jgi:2,5-dioxopentanoate dehydrogenase